MNTRIYVYCFLIPALLWSASIAQAESCDADCTVRALRSAIDNGDFHGAVEVLRSYQASRPLDSKFDPLCDDLLSQYSSTRSTSAVTADDISYLLRSGCHTHAGSTAELLWLRGSALFKRRDCQAAQKYFQRLIESYPQDPNTPRARELNADCQRQMATSPSQQK